MNSAAIGFIIIGIVCATPIFQCIYWHLCNLRNPPKPKLRYLYRYSGHVCNGVLRTHDNDTERYLDER